MRERVCYNKAKYNGERGDNSKHDVVGVARKLVVTIFTTAHKVVQTAAIIWVRRFSGCVSIYLNNQKKWTIPDGSSLKSESFDGIIRS